MKIDWLNLTISIVLHKYTHSSSDWESFEHTLNVWNQCVYDALRAHTWFKNIIWCFHCSIENRCYRCSNIRWTCKINMCVCMCTMRELHTTHTRFKNFNRITFSSSNDRTHFYMWTCEINACVCVLSTCCLSFKQRI